MRLLILTAAMALSGVAVAQTPPPPPASLEPTPEQSAALHAMAERLIAKTGHPELFESATKGPFAQVRHKESGAVCMFEADDEGTAIDLTPRKADSGFDVYCHAIRKGVMVTALTASRLHDKVPLDRLFRAASQTFRAEQSRAGRVKDAAGVFSDKDPIPGVMVTDLPPSMTARLTITVSKDLELFSRREVIEIGDWAVFSDFIVPRSPNLADPLGRIQAMGDFKAIADAQKAAAQ
jgi:hypothetical protein